MDHYEKALALWQRKKVKTDAELAEALNSHSISFAYHSGILNTHIIQIGTIRLSLSKALK